jgi:hypothetical protein
MKPSDPCVIDGGAAGLAKAERAANSARASR